jgi:sortase A
LVLSGASGRNLAFGPAHLAGTAPPGAEGNCVLAGHRDTHFAFLEDLAVGDDLWLETPDGAVRRYRVRDAAVVHESDSSPLEPTAEPVLTLVTCFPFDAALPGGPLRYVVRAVGR